MTLRERSQRAYIEKTKEEFMDLSKQGVYMAGNAAAQVLFVKGSLNDADQDSLFSGQDGKALRAALDRLGYAPQAWAGLASCTRDGQSLSPDLLRQAIASFDPETIIVCDAQACDMVREAYADELASLEKLEAAMLDVGVVAYLLGMRIMNLGNFEASLADKDTKRQAWQYLKQLAPLGEPF